MMRTITTLSTVALATALAAGAGAADEKKMAEQNAIKVTEQAEMASLEVGKAAPAFTAMDQNGNEVSLADFEGKVVVLEWTCPTCPVVQGHYAEEKMTMTKLAAQYGEKVVWLAVDSSNFATPELLKEWAEKKGIDYPILVDAAGDIGRMYGAKTTPHMFVIDAAGKLAYEGAIDNNPRGNTAEPVNYVQAAVDALLAGEPVATTSTKSYGCSVKYAKGV
jgi:peroxiredoxin